MRGRGRNFPRNLQHSHDWRKSNAIDCPSETVEALACLNLKQTHTHTQELGAAETEL